jgi:molecular chaperone DnaK (HSP70)
MTTIIGRNTIIPVRRSRLFSTFDDNQTAVHVKVVRGRARAPMPDFPRRWF